MTISRRSLIATSGLAASASALPILRARAQGKPVIKIGVLTDLSGPYKDTAGTLSTKCAELAGADFGISGKDVDYQVIQADHQNKPDVGAGIARQWFDRDGVDVILDVPNSGVALAVSGVAREKNKVYLNSGAASSDMTGSQCSPNTIHWSYDTYMLSKSTGGALVKAGGKKWYFVTADYAFGHALQRDASGFVTREGGTVLGSQAYPFPGTTDFSSFLLAAQASGAQVLGLANAGADTVNSIKQAKEFGISKQMTVAALLIFISDIHALGLDTAQGLIFTDSFYWDHNDRTRAFSKRLEPVSPGVRPGMVHAGVYSSALHFLKTVTKMGVAQSKLDGKATVAAMKALPVEDDCFGASTIRVDGRCIHPSFLWKVKTPAESKYPWDYLTLQQETPADEAFRPLNEGGCSLVKV